MPKKLNPDAVRELLRDPALSHEDRRFLQRELNAYDALVTTNPLQRYHPHTKQADFHTAQTTIKAFLGGNRSGKTTAGIADDLIQAVDLEALPAYLRPFKKWEPPFFCRILTPDFTSTMEGVVFAALRDWCPRSQLVGDSWDHAYNKQLRRLEFKNGSFFEFMTYEQALDKFGGAARHRIHYDEEPPKAIRTECKARLVDYGGDELFTMTPLHGMTWMFDEVYEKRYEPNVTVVTVATDENPHLNKQAMEEFFADLTDEERQARREGRFVHFGGLVLAAFDDESHVVDELLPRNDEAPAELRGQAVMVGIDPGIARGGVVWAAFDRDNSMLVFDELYPKNQTIEQIAAEIHAKNRYWRIRPQLYVIDPSARNRALTNAVTVQTEFMQENIPTIPGQNDRFAGIMQLRRRLTSSPIRLRVTRNCANWLRERSRWRVAEDEESSENKTTDDSFKTQGPDHLMDPTRYLAMQRIFGPIDHRPGQRRPAYQHGHEPAWTPGRRNTVDDCAPL